MIPYRTIRLCGYVVLFGAVLLAFLPCVGNDFVDWDDHAFVTHNYSIMSLSYGSLVWMFTTSYQGVWHPLTWLSHALDISLWGLNPFYHHLINVLFHCLNVLLFGTICIKLQDGFNRTPLSMYLAAFTAALLFGVHPLRVESVAWVAERKDVLCSFFYLCTIASYLEYCKAEEKRARRIWYGAAILLYVPALLSKPMAVTAPLVMLILDFYPLGRLRGASVWRCLYEKIPFVIPALGTAIMNMASTKGGIALSYVPIYVRVMNGFHSIALYLQKTVWPSKLVPLYQLDRSLDYFSAKYVTSALLVLAVTVAAVWRAVRNDRIWAAVWFYYIVTLGPTLGLFMSFRHASADRYTYLPTMGIWLLVGLGVARIWDACSRRQRGYALKVVLVSSVFLAALAYAYQTREQIGVWKNSDTLWTHVIETAENIPAVAYFGVGQASAKKGEFDKALGYYEAALRINPKNSNFRRAIANVFAKKGDREKALSIYRQILDMEPGNPVAHINVGRVLTLMGRTDEALSNLERALKLDPKNGRAWGLLTATHLERNDREKALYCY
ncbi:tetratricopeptide repeat protein, partial [Thermodesulfobacteriota bacterium]